MTVISCILIYLGREEGDSFNRRIRRERVVLFSKDCLARRERGVFDSAGCDMLIVALLLPWGLGFAWVSTSDCMCDLE